MQTTSSNDQDANGASGHVSSQDSKVEVLIIGAGFGGLGAAIKLQQAGVTDYIVLERAADIGGTWRDNQYPGAACDIPSKLYSYSFEPNPDWQRVYARSPEIWAYMQDVAQRHGLLAKVRLNLKPRPLLQTWGLRLRQLFLKHFSDVGASS